MARSDITRVLVIDDDDRARRAMCRMLRGAGFHVFDVDSPIGASRRCVRSEIDVVVVDVNMPAMRGEKLAAHFRSTPRLRQLSIVLVSGEHEDELASLAADVDADAAVSKSDIRQLAAAVSHAAQRASRVVL